MLKCSELDKTQLSLFGTVQHSNNKTSKKKKKKKRKNGRRSSNRDLLGKNVILQVRITIPINFHKRTYLIRKL